MIAPRFWARARPGFAARALAPLGALYGLATARRMARPGTRVDVPVVCVGNYVVGGAGKTPTAVAVARLLQRRRRAGRVPFARLRRRAARRADARRSCAARRACRRRRAAAAGARRAVLGRRRPGRRGARGDRRRRERPGARRRVAEPVARQGLRDRGDRRGGRVRQRPVFSRRAAARAAGAPGALRLGRSRDRRAGVAGARPGPAKPLFRARLEADAIVAAEPDRPAGAGLRRHRPAREILRHARRRSARPSPGGARFRITMSTARATSRNWPRSPTGAG